MTITRTWTARFFYFLKKKINYLNQDKIVKEQKELENFTPWSIACRSTKSVHEVEQFKNTSFLFFSNKPMP